MNWIRNRRKVLIATVTLLLVTVAMIVPLPLPTTLPGNRTVDINARAFAYDPATIQVRRGDKVTLHLEAMDSAHGLAIDGYDVDMQAEPGHSAEVSFVADREGTFKFRCSISCGALHPFMIGELKVTPDLPLARALGATAIAVLGALFYFWK